MVARTTDRFLLRRYCVEKLLYRAYARYLVGFSELANQVVHPVYPAKCPTYQCKNSKHFRILVAYTNGNSSVATKLTIPSQP